MKTTFTLLFLLFAYTAFAQQNFVTGYYMTLQGEKVDVQINDQNWDKNPTFIEVMREGGDTKNIQKITAADVKGIVLTSGDVFDAFVVEVDKSPTDFKLIQPGSQPLITRDTVLLRAIVKGVTNLYYLKDENAKEHYYISKGDDVPVELINRIARHKDETITGYVTLPIYRNTLSTYLTGCQKVSDQLETVSFKLKVLKNLVTEYNQCVSTKDGEYLATEEKIKWEIGGIVGVTYTALSIQSTDHKPLTEPAFSNAGYTIGASVTAILPRSRGKWAIKNEVMYKPLKFDGTYEEGVNDDRGIYTKVTTNFDMGYVGINSLVRYRLLDAGVKPYLIGGIANNFMMIDNNNQVVYRRFYATENTKEQKPIESIRKHEQALIVGVGFSLHKLAGEIRLERGNGFSPIANMKTSKNTTTLQLSYTL